MTHTHSCRSLAFGLVAFAITALFTVSNARAQAGENFVGSYGEMKYQHFENGDAPRLDVERFVLYFDHMFTSKWALRSETEIEHVKIEGGMGGEVGIEQAYLDYHASQKFGWKTGLVVLPIGIMNQTHEPTTFYSVERPLFDQEIIPSTWREIGTGIYGDLSSLVSYQLFVTEGLNARAISETGMDGAKQEGSATIDGDAVGSDASRPALSAKLNFDLGEGLKVGLSGYAQRSYNTGWSHGLVLADADLEFEHGPLRVRMEAATITTGDASRSHAVPTALRGGYAEVGYDVMPLLTTGQTKLIPFVRYESLGIDLPADTLAAGLNASRHAILAGLAFVPVRGIVMKADYRWMSGDLVDERSVFSLGAGYEF